MKQKLLSVFLLCIMLAGAAFAQDRKVTGKVTAKEDGLPLPGVSVKVTGTKLGAQTDANGNYSLNVPAGSKSLEFSFIGYVSQTISIGEKTTINATLVTDSKSLSEVVVTAVGITRDEKSIGYGASVLKSDAFTTARDANVLNSIAGKAAGVRINSQSGTLGGSTKIVIRGVNSLNGSDVLFVVDGTPLSNGTSAGGTIANNVDYGNRIGDLSSDDIASMTILKGAAATALYGSRAKDGAVIITTKKGNKNSNSISINSSVRFDNPLVLPDFQNQYAQGNYGVYNLKYTNGWGPKIADVQNQQFTDFTGQQVTLQAYPNNVKDFFQTGSSYTNNIAFSGGDDNSDYRFSFSSVNESGTIPKSTLDRYNLSLNAGRKFNNKLSSRFTGTYSRIKADGRPAQSSNNSNVLSSAIFGLPRVVSIDKLKNNFIDPITGNQIFLSTDKTGNNPYWIINYNQNNNTVDRFYGTYTLNYEPFKWLSLTNNLGGDIYDEKRASFTRKGTAGFVNGKFNNTDIFYRQINNDFLATITKDNILKDINLKFILGGNYNERQTQSTDVAATNLTIDQLYTYTNASSNTPTLGFAKQRLIGAYGDLSLNYKSFLYLDITGRNDWSSTLPVNSRSYFYPSISSSFVFSDLLSKKGKYKWLSFGKLRASYAQVGSDLGPYNLDFQYSPVSTVFLQYIGRLNAFPLGAITTAFSGPGTLPNANLVPQKQNSYEVGTEMKFLNNRIGLDFNYYNTTTNNQLISISVAPSTGYSAKLLNAGAIKNEGIEVALNLVPVKVKNFSWNVDVNYSKNKQKVTELTQGVTEYSLASGYSGLQIKANVGEEFGLYGTRFQRAPDGQFIINPNNGLRLVEANKRLGNIYPDYTIGINNSFSYKNFTLSGLVDIRQGGVFYSGTVAGLRTSGLAIETGGDRTPFVDKGVVSDGNGGYIPNTKAVNSVQDFWNLNYQTSNSEANIFDASYVKLREIRFSYTLPKSLFSSKTGIRGASIGVEGRNLWLIKSHVPHVDPELNFFGAGSTGEGVEFNSVPSNRSFGLNLRLSF
ncbi:MAG: SusC/RagA family TonB-linked outer membrane protein [Sphingobacteriales bacterium]|nr:SusC/RagA family TonB-linked outer membrane protein [Sphingobacteriales bacterium]